MKVIETIEGLTDELRSAGRPVGLVPTMGALHEGHMALVRRARSETETLAVSIFVNPTQFRPKDDLASYPRDMDADLAKLEDAGTDLVFAPSVAEMYPDGFDTFVDVGRIAERLEGQFRPNHFRGVATVVCKLLAIARPDRAYFGQKDAQQSLVVQRLNADLDLGAEIVVVPTVREADGLALSSRNIYLGPEERKAATVLHRSLRLAQELGTADAGLIRRRIRELIDREPLASIDYVSVAAASTLEELDRIDGEALVLLAVRIGKARLIDNLVLRHT